MRRKFQTDNIKRTDKQACYNWVCTIPLVRWQ